MKRLLFFILSMVTASTSLFAQTDVSGKVTDARDNSALSGVNVTVKGSRTGTTTDINGNFRISTPSNATLVFSNVGFSDKEVR
ncbi:MAG TPA: carboxypeptidase-like regulatory domain-containing protein, partial [Chitinophagaceae bacterium]